MVGPTTSVRASVSYGHASAGPGCQRTVVPAQTSEGVSGLQLPSGLIVNPGAGSSLGKWPKLRPA